MFCTNCGKQNEEGQAFCIHCGSPVPQAEKSVAFCTNCGKELRDSTNFCIHCGAARQSAQPEPPKCPRCGDPVDPGVRFCIRCGTSLQPATQTAPAQVMPVESKRTGLDLLLICLPLVLTLVAGAFQWLSHTWGWFIWFGDDASVFMVLSLLLIMPLLCLWAGMSRKNKKAKCCIALVFLVLDLLPQLLFYGLFISEEPQHLPRNLLYIVLCLSRDLVALIALCRSMKKAQ